MDFAAKPSMSAQSLERAGDLENAANAYLRAGAMVDAARVLSALRQFERAAHLLLSVAGPAPWSDVESAHAARGAASCLWQAGDHAASDAIVRALNEGAAPPQPAASPVPQTGARDRTEIASFARAGRFVDAARAAHAAGDLATAADFYTRADMPFEAGIAWYSVGAKDKALASFVAVPRAAPAYRPACMNAIHVASELAALSFEVHSFVADFASSMPTTEGEMRSLYQLSVVYEDAGFEDEACDALERVLAVHPAHEHAAARLAGLRAHADTGLARAAHEDASFWRATREPSPGERPPAIASRLSPFVPADHASSAPPWTPPPLEDLAPAAAPAAPPIAAGQLVAGRYRIEREVGRGGMGTVFRAHDHELGETVALKLFRRVPDQPTLLARFKQELTLCRQLTHPNIVRLHDLGTHKDESFITMELLDGANLRELRGTLDFARILGYLGQLCAGLEEVHARGIVHRDIKSANVFVTRAGVLKIMDFGLAKRAGAGTTLTTGLTVSGFMAGTPGYMAPEQYTDFGAVSALADLYALGVVAYELLSGTRPFVHKHASQLVRLQFTTLPRPLRDMNPRIPAALDAVVLALLDRDPSRRPQSAAGVAAAFASAAPLI